MSDPGRPVQADPGSGEKGVQQTTLDDSVTGSQITAAMARAGITQGAIVRETKLSRTTVSRVCDGQNPGDASRAQVLDCINAALRAKSETATPRPEPAPTPKAGGSARAAVLSLASARLPEQTPGLLAPWGGAYCTEGQRLLWAVLRATQKDRELSLLCALSGAGKSYLIDRYQDAYPETLVYRPLRGISQSGLLEDLCRLFGVPYSGSNDTRRRRLLESAAGRFLIIDEADLLVAGRYARQTVDRLEIYRQLQERGAGVALVGLPALIQTVVTGGETYVFSRVGYARTGAPPSQDELATYWKAQMAGYPQAAARAGAVALSAARHGHLRYLDKLARRCRDLEGDVAAAETLLFRGEQA